MLPYNGDPTAGGLRSEKLQSYIRGGTEVTDPRITISVKASDLDILEQEIRKFKESTEFENYWDESWRYNSNQGVWVVKLDWN
jgi:hypothetical protein